MIMRIAGISLPAEWKGMRAFALQLFASKMDGKAVDPKVGWKYAGHGENADAETEKVQ